VIVKGLVGATPAERLFLILFLVDVLLFGGFGRGRFWTLANFSWNAMK
jgi:hypothetical protein